MEPTTQPSDQPILGNPNQTSALDNNAQPTKTQIQQSQESIVKLKKRLVVLMELGVFITLILVVANFAVIYFSNEQVKLYRANRQQIAAALYNSSDLQNTVSFLEEQKQQTEIINKALPNETGFIEFVKTLELIAGEHSQNSQFEFDRGQKDQELSFVPITISMTTDSTNLSEFLKKSEKLAYIFQINSINATHVTDTLDLWQIKINARLYVNTKFRLNENG